MRKFTRCLPRFKPTRAYCTVTRNDLRKAPPSLAKQIHAKIKAFGPITIADYMKEVLVNPAYGYYMHRDVLGECGDFITSPELGQVFGEMVAVWLVNEWTKMGAPRPFQIVELGPGRSSLSQDVLRVFDHFGCLKGASLHLVEVSPTLADIQASRLCLQSSAVPDANADFYREGISHAGIPIRWYRHIDQVPQGFSLFVANEFFDVLPIHKVQRTNKGFREVLIDIVVDKEDEVRFRYILAKDDTPVTKMFVKQDEKRDHFEISLESMVICRRIAERIETQGGLALIIDYGHNGEGTDTFRAFKKHKLHEPLIEPGSADLTADVDFNLLKTVSTSSHDVVAFGPITQRAFLLNMGIDKRINVLKNSASEQQLDSINYGLKMLIDDDKMGKRFKFLSLFPGVMKAIFDKVPVSGF